MTTGTTDHTGPTDYTEYSGERPEGRSTMVQAAIYLGIAINGLNDFFQTPPKLQYCVAYQFPAPISIKPIVKVLRARIEVFRKMLHCNKAIYIKRRKNK